MNGLSNGMIYLQNENWIGKTAVIHQIDGTHVLVEITKNKKSLGGFKTKPKTISNNEKAVPRAGIEPATFRSSV